MQPRKHAPVFISLAVLAFGVSHLAYEHLSGGVRSHHLLARSDLPSVSNWLGLVILPLLGWALGVRVRNHTASSEWFGLSAGVWAGLVGSLVYGAGLAVAFEFEASTITSSMFIGLFVLAALLPIYRAEYILGFVIGMTFTFGGVLPSLIAGVFATASAIVRYCFRIVAAAVRHLIRSRSGAD